MKQLLAALDAEDGEVARAEGRRAALQAEVKAARLEIMLRHFSGAHGQRPELVALGLAFGGRGIVGQLRRQRPADAREV